MSVDIHSGNPYSGRWQGYTPERSSGFHEARGLIGRYGVCHLVHRLRTESNSA